MQKDKVTALIKRILEKYNWADIVPKFIDVLKMNIFVMDAEGNILLPPVKHKYGGNLLTDAELGFDFVPSLSFINKFEENGKYLEYIGGYRLHMYAIPVYVNKQTLPIAFFIIGPVVINKKLDINQYEELAKEKKVNHEKLLSELNDIRIVSNLTINSILNLISTTVKNNTELENEEGSESVDEKIYTDVLEHIECDDIKKLDRGYDKTSSVLSTFLETALKVTNTECGSIMMFDKNKRVLSVKVSKGINEDKIKDVSIPIGEGICGLVAKENKPLFIDNDNVNNRIKHLLKRPEIKQALVMPLSYDNNVFGILNLHTKKEEKVSGFNMDTLQSLSALLFSAL